MDEEEIKNKFGKIWEKLRAIEKKLDSKEVKEVDNLKSKNKSSLEDKISKLCTEINIDRKAFNSIIDVNDNKFSLKIPINEGTASSKQVKTTFVLMMLRDILLEEDFMKSSDIVVVLKRLGIKSIGNLASNLSKYKQLLNSKGKKGSKNSGFVITIPGIVEGKKILKEFIKHGRK